MERHIGLVALVVRDYDEAIAYYTEKLGFTLIEDQDMGEGTRWVVVRPSPGSAGLLLAKASNEEQKRHIGNQTGGRVGFFFYTDDFPREYEALKANGVEFLEEPRHEAYGDVAVFKDMYGNKWDLLSEDRGLISDGYHSFNDLYRHRRALFLSLARSLKDTHQVWRSMQHHEDDKPIYEGMFVMGIGMEPGTQISYHFKLAYWDDADFAQTLERAPKWDGHSPSDVLERLRVLAVE